MFDIFLFLHKNRHTFLSNLFAVINVVIDVRIDAVFSKSLKTKEKFSLVLRKIFSDGKSKALSKQLFLSVISLGSGFLKPVLIFLLKKNKKVYPNMVKWGKDNYIYDVKYLKSRAFKSNGKS